MVDPFFCQIERWKKKVSPEVRAAFFGALFFGLLSHGTGLFNKLAHHDEVENIFHMGQTLSSGRWALYLFEWGERLFYGTPNTSLPLFNGVISVLCIGASAGLIVNLLGIRSKTKCMFMGCIMAAFPMITALFAYMFTSHAYMIGLLMITFSAFLICKRTPWWMKIAGVVIGGTAVGIYQAFLSVFLCVILFAHIRKLIEENTEWRKYFTTAVSHVICILGVLLFYFICNRYFLNRYHIELSGYQGISQMGQMSIQQFFDRCSRAYREFFLPSRQVFQDMYPGVLHAVYLLMLVMGTLLAIRMIILTARKSKGKAALLVLFFGMVPLACNLIYVMAEDVHALMVYGQVMQVVLFTWLVDRLELPKVRIKQVVSTGTSLILAVMAVMYARYDNQCYLKDTLHQQEAISYYTTLITRIKSQPGYRPEMQVYFTDTSNAEHLRDADPTVYNIDELDFVRINPYWHNSMEYIHASTELDFIKIWCGADFSYTWDLDAEQWPEVKNMPSYPADGSIQIVRGMVVVKF